MESEETKRDSAREALAEIFECAKSEADVSNALHLTFMTSNIIPNGDHVAWCNPKRIVGEIQGAFKDADGFQWAIIDAQDKIAGIAISPRDSVRFNLERGFEIHLEQLHNYQFMVKKVTAKLKQNKENKTTNKPNAPKF